MASAAPTAVDDAKAVLNWAMDTGSFDELRKLLLDQLRNDEGLKQYSLELLEGSKTLENVEWQNTRNKKTFDDLKKEIEEKLMAKASATVWSLMDAKDSNTSKLIEARVHEGLCTIYEERHNVSSSTQKAPA
mmetsp:Transcript_12724/g.34687  ORF Transcript_12724/g.34687 Transcript_12724/m.34687 type:complete len:132 (+) Transcript_12724:2420-2815(+)